MSHPVICRFSTQTLGTWFAAAIVSLVCQAELATASVKARSPAAPTLQETSTAVVKLNCDEVPLLGALCALEKNVPRPNGIRITIDLDAKTYELAGPRQSVLRAVESVKRSAEPRPQTLIEARVLELSSRRAQRVVSKLLKPIAPLAPESNAQLDILERHGQARTLAAPRLLAMDGIEAALSIGDKIVFSGGPLNAPDVELDHGLELKITPRVLSSGDREFSIVADGFTNGKRHGRVKGSITLSLGHHAIVTFPGSPLVRRKKRGQSGPIVVICSPQDFDSRKFEELLRSK